MGVIVAITLIVLLAGCADPTPDRCKDLPREAYRHLEELSVSSDWFKVYAVAPGVIAITEPFQWQEVISYLVLGSERAILFDTGLGIGALRAVTRELTNKPVTVVNSHTHFDHIGGNAEFDHVLGMNTDHTRKSAQGLPNEDVREEVAPAALCRPLPDGVSEDTYRIRPFVIHEFIRDGHEIDLGDRVLEVLSIPGHAPDAIALLDREAGYLWTGDSFYEGTIWLYWPGTDLQAYEQSVERMANLVPALTMVFPSHSNPIAAPARLLELRDAFQRVMNGSVDGSPRSDGVMRFEVGAISFLMRSR